MKPYKRKFKEDIISIGHLFNNKKVNVSYYDTDACLIEINGMIFKNTSSDYELKKGFDKFIIPKRKIKVISEYEQEPGYELHMINGNYISINLYK